MTENETHGFICCVCHQTKNETCFSKNQARKAREEKEVVVKCLECQALLEVKQRELTKQEKKARQQQKVVDPSLQYFLHPLNAPVIKEFQRFFTNQYGMEIEVSLGKKTKWRTSVKLAVRGEIGKDKNLVTKIGLFSPGSHSVVECISSAAHHPRINEAVKLIQDHLISTNIGGYIEGLDAEDRKIQKYKAYLRYVLLSVERKSGLVQLTLVWNAAKSHPVASPLLESLIEQLITLTSVKNSEDFSYRKSKLFHSIWVNYFPVVDIHNNAISGRERENWELKFGKEYVEEHITTDFKYELPAHLAKTTKAVKPLLYFPPFVFRQANIDKFEEIIQLIRLKMKEFCTSYPDREYKCLELYGGVGTIGLNCLDLLSRLQCSDENPHNITSFNKSLLSFPKDLQLKASYRTFGAAASVMNGEVFQNNLIIVDPPRKGMDEETVKALIASASTPSLAAATNTSKKQKISFDEEGNITDGNESKSELTPKRMFYVSCGFEAFKRDCALLTGKQRLEDSIHLFQSPDATESAIIGKRKRTEPEVESKWDHHWKLTYAKGFVLFPGSDHIETVAIFDRD